MWMGKSYASYLGQTWRPFMVEKEKLNGNENWDRHGNINLNLKWIEIEIETEILMYYIINPTTWFGPFFIKSIGLNYLLR